MRYAKLILTLFLVTVEHSAVACDCGSQGVFLTVAPKSDFVALVKVTKYLSYESIYERLTPMSMQVEVIDIYRGREKRRTLTVWGDNGFLCRPYLSQFDTGKFYVIAFYKASDGSKGYVHKNETSRDYAISICGDFWLTADMNNQTAVGEVSNTQNEIKLSELKRKLYTKYQLRVPGIYYLIVPVIAIIIGLFSLAKWRFK